MSLLSTPSAAPVLGIDFGTSNSVVAIGFDDRVLPIRFADGPVQRTLFFLPDDPDESEAAKPLLLGNAAARAYYKDRLSGRMIEAPAKTLACAHACVDAGLGT